MVRILRGNASNIATEMGPGFVVNSANLMPSNTHTEDITLTTSGMAYTAPDDGWIMFKRTTTAIGQYVALVNNSNNMKSSDSSVIASQEIITMMPVKKGTVANIHWSATTAGSCTFIHSEKAFPVSESAADYITSFANNLTGTGYTNGWYRIWASGWVEQGGIVTNGASSVSVTLPVTMANTNFNVTATKLALASTTSMSASAAIASTSSISVKAYENNANSATGTTSWEVKGFKA